MSLYYELHGRADSGRPLNYSVLKANGQRIRDLISGIIDDANRLGDDPLSPKQIRALHTLSDVAIAVATDCVNFVDRRD